MAITRRQQHDGGPEHRVHQCVYPYYYTATSTESAYDDFKYKYIITTTDGIISTSKNPPYITNEVGVYNPNSILKNLFTIDFNPDTTTFTAVENSMFQYMVTVEEMSGSVGSPDSENFQTQIVLKNSTPNFDCTDYILARNKTEQNKMLSNQTQTIKLRTTDSISKRIFNGILRPGPTYSDYNSYVYQIVVEKDGQKYWSDQTNPFWSKTYTQLSTTSVASVEGRLLDIPCGPEQFNNMTWKYKVGGIWTPQILTLEAGDTYTVYTYAWPYGDGGLTSIGYDFEVIDDCGGMEGILVAWENRLGGFDYMLYNDYRDYGHEIDRSVYRQERDSLQPDSFMTMGHSDYDKGETAFNTNIDSYYNVIKKQLSDKEIIYLTDLYWSENVYANVDGTWHPVIVTNKSKSENIYTGSVLNKDMRQSELNLKVCNKIYL